MPPPTHTQDRLARAQQPFSSSSSSSSRPPAFGKGKMPISPTPTFFNASGFETREEKEKEEEMESNEMWELRQKRQDAAVVQANWEMLAWYGISARESLPQTRLALQKAMLGISSPASDIKWRDEYYGESTVDLLALQKEQREGGEAVSSGSEGKGGARAGRGGAVGGGGGSSSGKGARGSSRRR